MDMSYVVPIVIFFVAGTICGEKYRPFARFVVKLMWWRS